MGCSFVPVAQSSITLRLFAGVHLSNGSSLKNAISLFVVVQEKGKKGALSQYPPVESFDGARCSNAFSCE